jgi:predicted  nucleic acid-binding Zn-ribbon protein
MSDTPETDSYANRDWWTLFRANEHARELERERDEAQKQLSSIHRWIERNHSDGFIDSLSYLQNLERVADNWYDRIDAIEKDSKRFVRERDELREAIPAGEWVAYEDHQKVHDAASRLLVAINKQLPIGCFILINSEYHRLQNAIYGREGAK